MFVFRNDGRLNHSRRYPSRSVVETHKYPEEERPPIHLEPFDKVLHGNQNMRNGLRAPPYPNLAAQSIFRAEKQKLDYAGVDAQKAFVEAVDARDAAIRQLQKVTGSRDVDRLICEGCHRLEIQAAARQRALDDSVQYGRTEYEIAMRATMQLEETRAQVVSLREALLKASSECAYRGDEIEDHVSNSDRHQRQIDLQRDQLTSLMNELEEARELEADYLRQLSLDRQRIRNLEVQLAEHSFSNRRGSINQRPRAPTESELSTPRPSIVPYDRDFLRGAMATVDENVPAFQHGRFSDYPHMFRAPGESEVSSPRGVAVDYWKNPMLRKSSFLKRHSVSMPPVPAESEESSPREGVIDHARSLMIRKRDYLAANDIPMPVAPAESEESSPREGIVAERSLMRRQRDSSDEYRDPMQVAPAESEGSSPREMYERRLMPRQRDSVDENRDPMQVAPAESEGSSPREDIMDGRNLMRRQRDSLDENRLPLQVAPAESEGSSRKEGIMDGRNLMPRKRDSLDENRVLMQVAPAESEGSSPREDIMDGRNLMRRQRDSLDENRLPMQVAPAESEGSSRKEGIIDEKRMKDCSDGHRVPMQVAPAESEGSSPREDIMDGRNLMRRQRDSLDENCVPMQVAPAESEGSSRKEGIIDEKRMRDCSDGNRVPMQVAPAESEGSSPREGIMDGRMSVPRKRDSLDENRVPMQVAPAESEGGSLPHEDIMDARNLIRRQRDSLDENRLPMQVAPAESEGSSPREGNIEVRRDSLAFMPGAVGKSEQSGHLPIHRAPEESEELTHGDFIDRTMPRQRINHHDSQLGIQDSPSARVTKMNKHEHATPNSLRKAASELLVHVDSSVKPVICPIEGDHVSIEYTGEIISSKTQFETNVQSEFEVGEGETIHGLDEGIRKVPLGAAATLEVPAALAYGKNGKAGLVPPNADLCYKVKLMKMNKKTLGDFVGKSTAPLHR